MIFLWKFNICKNFKMLMLMQELLAPMCAHKFLFDMEILIKNDNERKNHGAKGFKERTSQLFYN